MLRAPRSVGLALVLKVLYLTDDQLSTCYNNGREVRIECYPVCDGEGTQSIHHPDCLWKKAIEHPARTAADTPVPFPVWQKRELVS